MCLLYAQSSSSADCKMGDIHSLLGMGIKIWVCMLENVRLVTTEIYSVEHL